MIPETTANVEYRSPLVRAEDVEITQEPDHRALVGEDVQPGERANEVRDEERGDDAEEEEVPPRPGPEGDPVDERVREQERSRGRDTGIEERTEELLTVFGERVGEVRELPREFEVPVTTGLQRLVPEEARAG